MVAKALEGDVKTIREAYERRESIRKAGLREAAEIRDLEVQNRHLAEKLAAARKDALLKAPDLEFDGELLDQGLGPTNRVTDEQLRTFKDSDWRVMAAWGRLEAEAEWAVRGIAAPTDEEWAVLVRYAVAQRPPIDPRSGRDWVLILDRLIAKGVLRQEPVLEETAPAPVDEIPPQGTPAYEHWEKEQYLGERLTEKFEAVQKLKAEGIDVPGIFSRAISIIEGELHTKLPDNAQQRLMTAWCERDFQFNVPGLVTVGRAIFPSVKLGTRCYE